MYAGSPSGGVVVRARRGGSISANGSSNRTVWSTATRIGVGWSIVFQGSFWLIFQRVPPATAIPTRPTSMRTRIIFSRAGSTVATFFCRRSASANGS